MRLALFTDSNIYGTDGVSRIVQAMNGYIQRHPEHHLLVFHRCCGAARAGPRGENVRVHGVAVPYLPLPRNRAYPLVYLVNPRKRLLRITRDFRPDLLLTVSPYVPQGIGRSALYVARELGIPLVGSFDLHLLRVMECHTRERLAHVPRVAQRLLRWTDSLLRGYEECALILAPSAFIAGYIAERYGPSKCVQFPRGVDCERFSPRFRDEALKAPHGIRGKVAILYVGRFSLEKNLDTLLDVYLHLKKAHGELALVLVGDGPERRRLAGLELPDVVVTGLLHGDELSRAYASAEIFAFPSLVDAGPMVIGEAMASGLPVVVFNQGGARDTVIHGETGFVAKDSTEFLAYVERLVRDGQLRSRMGAKARRYAETQTWDRILDDLLAIFDELKRAHS